MCEENILVQHLGATGIAVKYHNTCLMVSVEGNGMIPESRLKKASLTQPSTLWASGRYNNLTVADGFGEPSYRRHVSQTASPPKG